MRVVADRDTCIGSGMCVMTDPAVFDQDDEGVVVVLDADVPAAEAANTRAAVGLCPAGALRLAD